MRLLQSILILCSIAVSSVADIKRIRHYEVEDFKSAWGAGAERIRTGNPGNEGGRNSPPASRRTCTTHSYAWSISVDETQHPPSIVRHNRFEPSTEHQRWGTLPSGEQYSPLLTAHGSVWGFVRRSGEWNLVTASLLEPQARWATKDSLGRGGIIGFVLDRNGDPVVYRINEQTGSPTETRGTFTGGGETILWETPRAVPAFEAKKAVERFQQSGGLPEIIGEFDLERPSILLAFSWDDDRRDRVSVRCRSSRGADTPYGPWSQPLESTSVQLNQEARYFQYQLTVNDGQPGDGNNHTEFTLTYKEAEKDRNEPFLPSSHSSGSGGSGSGGGADPDFKDRDRRDEELDKRERSELPEGDKPSRDSSGQKNSKSNASDHSASNSDRSDSKNDQPQTEKNTDTKAKENTPSNSDPDSKQSDKKSQSSEKSNKPNQANSNKSKPNKNDNPKEKNDSSKPSDPPEQTSPNPNDSDNDNNSNNDNDNDNDNDMPNSDSEQNPPSAPNDSPPNNNPQNAPSPPSNAPSNNNPSTSAPNNSPSNAPQNSGQGNGQGDSSGNGQGSGAGTGGANGEGAPETGDSSQGDESKESSPTPPETNSKTPDSLESSQSNPPSQKNNTPPQPPNDDTGNPGGNPSGTKSGNPETPASGDSGEPNTGQPGGESENPSGSESGNPLGNGEPESGDTCGGEQEKNSDGSGMGESDGFSPRPTGSMAFRRASTRKPGGSASTSTLIPQAATETIASVYQRSPIPPVSTKTDRRWPWFWWLLVLLSGPLAYREYKRRKTSTETRQSDNNPEEERYWKQDWIQSTEENDPLWEGIVRFNSDVSAIDLWGDKLVLLHENGTVCQAPIFKLTALPEKVENSEEEKSPATVITQLKASFQQAHTIKRKNGLFVFGTTANGKEKAIGIPLNDDGQCVGSTNVPYPNGLPRIDRILSCGGRIWALGEADSKRKLYSLAVSGAKTGEWREECPSDLEGGQIVAVSTGDEPLIAGVPEKDPNHLWIYRKEKNRRSSKAWKPIGKTLFRTDNVLLHADSDRCFLMEAAENGQGFTLKMFTRGEKGNFTGRVSNSIPLSQPTEFHDLRIVNGYLVAAGREVSQYELDRPPLVLMTARVGNVLKFQASMAA